MGSHKFLVLQIGETGPVLQVVAPKTRGAPSLEAIVGR